MTTTMITAGLLGQLLLFLGGYVVAGRVEFKIGLGDGGNESMQSLARNAGAPFRDNHTFGTTFVPGGAAFTAAGTGRIDLVGTGGFTGSFQSAGFTWATGSQTLSIAGSSLDGTFYGPGAAEVGASLRIVGGTPDQRVDILGALTGAR